MRTSKYLKVHLPGEEISRQTPYRTHEYVFGPHHRRILSQTLAVGLGLARGDNYHKTLRQALVFRRKSCFQARRERFPADYRLGADRKAQTLAGHVPQALEVATIKVRLVTQG